MRMFIVIWCILTAYVQASLPDKGENDQNRNRPVSRPTIHSPSTEISIGENVTLKCSSGTGSPPINYTLYRGTNRVLPPVRTNKMGEEAEFHFIINSISELGEYKCKTENKFNKEQYSIGFNFTMTESLSHLEIYSPSSEVSIGENVTLYCLSRTGSLPIEYSLYKGKDRVQCPKSKNKSEEAAEFHFPINFISELGEYKCKAKNKFTKNTYSVGFNFTMKAGENNNLVAFIVPPLLLLLLAIVVAIPFLILPWCKATHEKDQEEYVNMEFCTKEEISRKVSFKDATTVVYSEVVFRR